MTWDEQYCHCGRPLAYGFDGHPLHHRGMCAHCDAVRCDVEPQVCGLMHTSQEQEQKQ